MQRNVIDVESCMSSTILNSIIFEKIFVLGMLYFWDSTVFATREEAEKKLEEMKKWKDLQKIEKNIDGTGYVVTGVDRE